MRSYTLSESEIQNLEINKINKSNDKKDKLLITIGDDNLYFDPMPFLLNDSRSKIFLRKINELKNKPFSSFDFEVVHLFFRTLIVYVNNKGWPFSGLIYLLIKSPDSLEQKIVEDPQAYDIYLQFNKALLNRYISTLSNKQIENEKVSNKVLYIEQGIIQEKLRKIFEDIEMYSDVYLKKCSSSSSDFKNYSFLQIKVRKEYLIIGTLLLVCIFNPLTDDEQELLKTINSLDDKAFKKEIKLFPINRYENTKRLNNLIIKISSHICDGGRKIDIDKVISNPFKYSEDVVIRMIIMMYRNSFEGLNSNFKFDDEILIRFAIKFLKRIRGNHATMTDLYHLIANTRQSRLMIQELITKTADPEKMAENADIAQYFINNYFNDKSKTFEHCSGARAFIMSLYTNKFFMEMASKDNINLPYTGEYYIDCSDLRFLENIKVIKVFALCNIIAYLEESEMSSSIYIGKDLFDAFF